MDMLWINYVVMPGILAFLLISLAEITKWGIKAVSWFCVKSTVLFGGLLFEKYVILLKASFSVFDAVITCSFYFRILLLHFVMTSLVNSFWFHGKLIFINNKINKKPSKRCGCLVGNVGVNLVTAVSHLASGLCLTSNSVIVSQILKEWSHAHSLSVRLCYIHSCFNVVISWTPKQFIILQNQEPRHPDFHFSCASNELHSRSTTFLSQLAFWRKEWLTHFDFQHS